MPIDGSVQRIGWNHAFGEVLMPKHHVTHFQSRIGGFVQGKIQLVMLKLEEIRAFLQEWHRIERECYTILYGLGSLRRWENLDVHRKVG